MLGCVGITVFGLPSHRAFALDQGLDTLTDLAIGAELQQSYMDSTSSPSLGGGDGAFKRCEAKIDWDKLECQVHCPWGTYGRCNAWVCWMPHGGPNPAEGCRDHPCFFCDT